MTGQIAEIKNLDHKLIMELYGAANFSTDKGEGWEIVSDDGLEIIIHGRDSYAGMALDQNDGLNGNWELLAEKDEQEAAIAFVKNAFPSLGRFDVTAY